MSSVSFSLLRGFLAAATLPFPGERARAEANARANRAAGGGAPVTDQRTLAGLRFGYTTAAFSGCEAIAVYNAALLCGGCLPLGEALRRTERGRSLMLGGWWGANPYRMAPVLAGCGLASRPLKNAAALGAAAEGSVWILSVWNRKKNPLKGIHTFAVQRETGGRWASYNQYYGPGPRRFASAGALLAGEGLIAGWEITGLRAPRP